MLPCALADQPPPFVPGGDLAKTHAVAMSMMPNVTFFSAVHTAQPAAKAHGASETGKSRACAAQVGMGRLEWAGR